ncbi:WecB/TagA/CpsF family glycosyltransferase [Candidatus Daviesbacteria bacterium]|nr:WecB/TagA/CpsF family glycosyltransferase [Candidatus Daviesbacteria bacterium]
MMKKYILGVKIDDVNMDEALEIVHQWLQKSEKRYIVTPNPEFIMTAQKDPEFKETLNNADLSIPDGAGLKLSGRIKNIVAGVDLMERLVDKSRDWGVTVGLLGGGPGVAEKAAECLQKKYPKIKIDNIAPDILFVAFGAPKQEKWIVQNLPKLKVKVAMGVGGAFDYLSGKVPRAPEFLRSLGLEWLFRLIIQPWRIKRQMALLRYLWFVLNSK